MLKHSSQTPQRIAAFVTRSEQVDAIYLYDSRARGLTHSESDWGIALLFSHWESGRLEALLRPQAVEVLLQRELKLYGRISAVDLALVPPLLQFNRPNLRLNPPSLGG